MWENLKSPHLVSSPTYSLLPSLPSPSNPRGTSISPIQSAPSSKAKHLFLGIGIGLLVAIIGLASFFLDFNSNNSSLLAQAENTSEIVLSEASNSFTASSEESVQSQQESSQEVAPSAPSAPTVIVQAPVAPSAPAIPSVDSLARTYVANCNMKVRSLLDYNATSVSHITQSTTFVVTNTTSGSNYSIWGQLPEENWICVCKMQTKFLS